MNCVYIVVFLAACFFAKSEADNCIRYGSGVSAAEQKIIVDKHNELRKAVANGQVGKQPPASNMKRLQWDAKLAVEAQKIANTCVDEHVDVSDDRFFRVGQNLRWAGSPVVNNVADWKASIQKWFDEQLTFTFGSGVLNHYTQVVWAEAKYIGCGFLSYDLGGTWKEQLYFCNYGPGQTVGNPYKNGTVGCKDLC